MIYLPSIEGLNIHSIVPMLITCGGGLVIICIDLIQKNLSRSFYTMLSILFIFASLLSVVGFDSLNRGFFDFLYLDGISILSQIIILLGAALFIPLALASKRFHEYHMPEFYSLFLFMVCGFQFAVSSDNLILILIGLEIGSLSSCILIALHNRNKSFEASIKYFILGIISTAFYIYGAMLFYAVAGSFDIRTIMEVLYLRGFEPLLLVASASVFILISLSIKLSIVPFHTWAPDVYEGASAALAGFMSIVPKIAALIPTVRIFESLVILDIFWLKYILYILIVLTITLSNIMALVQTDVKRMLGYSTISHTGFIMAAVLIATTEANVALFVYMIVFLFSNLGAFTMVWISRHKRNLWDKRYQHPFVKFSGMIYLMPVGAVLMAVFMLSLAGIPPFSVFWGKLLIMKAAVDNGYILLAIVMALNTPISAYYYMKLVVYMFLRNPQQNDGAIYVKNASLALKTIIGFSAIASMFSFLIMTPLLEYIYKLVLKSGF